MSDYMAIFQGTLIAIVILLTFGAIVWMFYAQFKRSFPNLRWQIKYKILKKQYDENIVRELMDDLENNVNEEELYKAILIDGKYTEDQAKEFIYIYKQLRKIKMKGGIKK